MSPRRPAGFSLVELMVALALSLAMTALMGTIWANNRRGFKSQDNRARIQENGRFALQVLERELRLAGYKGLGKEAADPTLLFGSGGQAAALAGNNDTSSVQVNPGAALTTDTVTVAFYGSGTGATGDGSVTNCFGTGIAAGTQVQDSFYVQLDATTGLPSLVCRSIAGGVTTLAVLAYSVESLQILYGEETDGLATGTPNRFVQSSSVGANNWSNVTQVRLSLLLRGEDRTSTPAKGLSTPLQTVAATAPFGAKYYHFGTTYYNNDTTGDTGALSDLSAAAAQDGRQRLLFGTTVTLRNRTN